MRMIDFPESRQIGNYDCGANALLSVLSYHGIDVDESTIIKIAHTTKRSGTSINGIKKVLKKFKLKYKDGKIDIETLKKYVKKKIPVIIPLQAWETKKVKNWNCEWDSGHYVIPIGYDKKKIYFEDPVCITRAYLTFKELEERWHDKDDKTKKRLVHFGIAVFGKHPTKKPVHMD
jgi:ABC-type bacteriocin/lantibiotic exporter with double-glycine peptidase domain